jgi:hypothetical protein
VIAVNGPRRDWLVVAIVIVVVLVFAIAALIGLLAKPR